jgi:hypothetical protein
MLMLGLAGLSLSNCATPLKAVDSYCQVYQPVVVEKGDGTITAKTTVKKRILANELTYRDQCATAK